MITLYPQYYKEYFYVFAVTGSDIPYDMAKFLLKQFDLELVGDEFAFIVKGEIVNVEKCVEKYSEFFESWEKIDKCFLEICDASQELEQRVKSLPDYIGSIVVDKKAYNEEIDDIIKELKKLKIE